MRKVLLIIFLISPFINGFGQGVSFYKENITMNIERGNFYVSGVYYVKSDKKKIETVSYPYPHQLSYGEVDSIYIFNLTTNEIIMPEKTDINSTVFKMDFSNNNELMIQISYKHKLLANRAEYILKSTISWKKPLEQANYQLIIPSNLNVYRFSIPPQDSIITNKKVVYYWEKHNYMPVENFIFEYKMK